MSLKELEKRLKKEPDNLGLRVQVAGLMREAGRSTEAVELYRSVALAYRDQGRTQQAIAVCRAILEIAPEDDRCIALLSTLQGRSAPSIPSIAPPPAAPTRSVGPSQAPPSRSGSPSQLPLAPEPRRSEPSIALSRPGTSGGPPPAAPSRPARETQSPPPAAPSRPASQSQSPPSRASTPSQFPLSAVSPAPPPPSAVPARTAPEPRSSSTRPPPVASRPGSASQSSAVGHSPRTSTQPPASSSQPPATSSRPPLPKTPSSPPGRIPPIVVIPPKAGAVGIPPKVGARASSEATPAPAPSRPPTEPAPPSPVTARLPLEPPARKTPSQPPSGEPKRRSSLEETPLPKPVPHHVHDPTGRNASIDPEELDTNPHAEPKRTKSGTGLAEAARKISDKMKGIDDDVSRPLDTRPVRRIKSDELEKIQEPPPTVEHERVSDDQITSSGEEDELTTPQSRIDPDDV